MGAFIWWNVVRFMWSRCGIGRDGTDEAEDEGGPVEFVRDCRVLLDCSPNRARDVKRPEPTPNFPALHAKERNDELHRQVRRSYLIRDVSPWRR